MMNAVPLKCGSLPTRSFAEVASRLQTGLSLKGLSIASLPKRLAEGFPGGASGGASEEFYRLLLLC